MQTDFVNLKRIQRIQVTDKRLNGEVVYKAPKKKFWGGYTKATYAMGEDCYWESYTKYDSLGELVRAMSQFLFNGNYSYYKPKVYIEFINKESITARFETYEEALTFARNVVDNSPDILFELK